MKVLVTGSNGFVGKNLVASLKNIRDGKDRTRSFFVEEVYEYDIDTDPSLLDTYCKDCDFVFNLAGGSFTELLKTENCGQFSVNISKPGITKGQHWHHSKWEFFIVVSGKALIQERRIDSNEVIEFEVSGDNIQAIHMLPGYTHNIINLSDTQDLVTVMWANEAFDPNHPDTFFEEV